MILENKFLQEQKKKFHSGLNCSVSDGSKVKRITMTKNYEIQPKRHWAYSYNKIQPTTVEVHGTTANDCASTQSSANGSSGTQASADDTHDIRKRERRYTELQPTQTRVHTTPANDSTGTQRSANGSSGTQNASQPEYKYKKGQPKKKGTRNDSPWWRRSKKLQRRYTEHQHQVYVIYLLGCV